MITYYKCVLKGDLLGQQIRNIFHFKFDDPAGVNLPDGLFASYWGGFTTPLTNLTVVAMVYSGYDRYKWSGTSWEFEKYVTYSVTGGSSGDALPNQVAAVMLGKVVGRRGFGRKFWSGISEVQQVSGSLVAGAIGHLVNLAAAYIAPQTSGALVLTPGVWDKTNQFHGFTSAVVDVLLGTMRRRKIGVGL
jgi:hypothetical protein